MKKLHIFFSQTSQSFFQLFIILFISKNESIAIVGIYGVILAYLNPLTTIIKLGIPQYILSVDDETDLHDHFKLLTFNNLLFLTLTFLTSLFLKDNFKGLLISVSILKFSQTIREALESKYIVKNDHKKLFQIIFLGNIFSIFSFIVIYYLFNSLNLSILVTGITLFIFSDLDFFKSIKFKKNINIKRQQYLTLLKITASKFLNSLKSSSPKLIGQIVLSFDDLGVLTLFQQAVNLFDVINNFLLKYYNRQIVNSFLNHSKRNIIKSIKNYLTPLLFVCLISILIIYFVGDYILELVFNKEIAKHSILLILFLCYKLISMYISLPKIVFIIYNKVQITLVSLAIQTLAIIPFLLLCNSLYQIIYVLLVFEFLLFLGLTIICSKLSIVK